MLTLDILKTFKPNEIISTGCIVDSPLGINMTNSGKQLRWVAIKGEGYDDWAIYCHWDYHDIEWIKERGDKVANVNNIQRCIECTEEVIGKIREFRQAIEDTEGSFENFTENWIKENL